MHNGIMIYSYESCMSHASCKQTFKDKITKGPQLFSLNSFLIHALCLNFHTHIFISKGNKRNRIADGKSSDRWLVTDIMALLLAGQSISRPAGTCHFPSILIWYFSAASSGKSQKVPQIGYR